MSWLTLDQFCNVISYHPYHFFGLGDNDKLRPTSACNTYVREYGWQGFDSAGRNDVVRAIDQAESKIRNFLGYALMPHYVEETIPWPKYLDQRLFRYGASGANGFRLPIKLSEGKVLAIGVETKTLVGSINVTYSDANGDGVNDTFTLDPIPTTLTDPSKFKVYFSIGERFDDTTLSERWQIRPITVKFLGGNAIISGRIWLASKPALKDRAANLTAYAPIDPSVTSNFPATMDVYTCTTKTDGQTISDSQCVLLWETFPCEGWWCCGWDNLNWTPTDARFDPAGVGMAIGRVGIRDAELGIVLPAQALYNSTNGQWFESWNALWREPNRVTIRYYAGDALAADGELKQEWQTLIARMACAELMDRLCSCDIANKEIYRWQVDFTARKSLAGDSFNAQPGDLENPFGTRAGHIEAWRRLKILAKMHGTHP
jgi:hypothetical protein